MDDLSAVFDGLLDDIAIVASVCCASALVDWLRNAIGNTAIASYCPRASWCGGRDTACLGRGHAEA
jgi:hypothetical protein